MAAAADRASHRCAPRDSKYITESSRNRGAAAAGVGAEAARQKPGSAGQACKLQFVDSLLWTIATPLFRGSPGATYSGLLRLLSSQVCSLSGPKASVQGPILNRLADVA